MQSPVLFFDFDGVLNNDTFLRHQKNHVPREQHRLFDPASVQALQHLLETLKVERCVVSSTWRKDRSVEQLQELLRKEGLTSAYRVLGVTPVLGRSLDQRAAEIAAWIATHEPARYIILDDFALEGFGDSFFKTDPATGLTRELVDRIISAFAR